MLFEMSSNRTWQIVRSRLMVYWKSTTWDSSYKSYLKNKKNRNLRFSLKHMNYLLCGRMKSKNSSEMWNLFCGCDVIRLTETHTHAHTLSWVDTEVEWNCDLTWLSFLAYLLGIPSINLKRHTHTHTHRHTHTHTDCMKVNTFICLVTSWWTAWNRCYGDQTISWHKRIACTRWRLLVCTNKQ